ncbi:MAG: RNA-binding S4 domain-containing protein [Paracoccus sp. (in: a-proteobacteria)]|nr:RNA-binding S4 domain-containing protein [Paracoccus sp. (in: a-proteobacteria)]
MADDGADTLRLDKWLFHARLFKARGLAADRIEGGGVRVNGAPVRKPGRAIRPGDQITVSAHGRVIALRVLALGTRRGPAPEARELYELLGDDPSQG